MTLYDLFFKCVTISYQKTGGEANFAVEYRGNTLYIFFEGSDGEQDWRVNLDFPAKAYMSEDGSVWYAHRGFSELWAKTEPYLSGMILDPETEHIVIVGYSHGGAMAMLCHEYVYSSRPDLRGRIESYGFGAPRVFWGLPVNRLAKRWQGFSVIRNLDDAVTHLPPKLLGYSHVGKVVEIGEKGRYSPIDAHRAENILYQLKLYENI